MKKLAIVCTHPIQYYAPLFALLAKDNRTEVKVFYTWGEASLKKHDPGFNKVIEWDLPLLDGYNYILVKNTSKSPGSSHFSGIINPTLVHELEAFGPSAILIYGWAYQSHLKVLRYFKNKIPLWFRGDSTLINTPSSLNRILRSLFLTWIYKHIDIAFYVGEENRKYYKEFGIKDHQLEFAPHAIDNVRFTIKSDSSSISIKKSLNITPDQVMILFAGKFESVKNPELLLRAFLINNVQNAHLVFVGNGILEDKLKEIAQNHSNVHFVEFQNQSTIPLFYQACDLFCLPSLSETWGLAVNEAMACGKAVLVSNKVGCAVDLVLPGVNGEVFESNNIQDLQSRLLTLLADKGKLKSYGEASKKIIQNWSFERSCEAILNKLHSSTHN